MNGMNEKKKNLTSANDNSVTWEVAAKKKSLLYKRQTRAKTAIPQKSINLKLTQKT